MKQALFILAAFLLLSPSISSGQDFEVVGLTTGKIAVTKDVTTEFDTTGVVIKNISTSSITINCSFDEEWFRVWGVTHDIISISISPGQSRTLKIKYGNYGSCGIYRANLTLKSSSLTQIIVYEANIVCDILKYSTESIVIMNTKVGDEDCIPIFGTNNSTKVVNIYELPYPQIYSDSVVKYTNQIPLPYLVLPGETIKFAEVCFKPKLPSYDYSGDGRFTTTDGTQSIYYNFLSSKLTDTNLLKPCIQLTDNKSIIGPILFGGDTTHTLFFKSNRYDTTFVNDVVFYGGDGLMFKMEEPLPDTLLPLSLTPVKVRFSPTTLLPVVKDRFAVDARFTTSCGNFSIDLSALAMHPTADSIATPLFPDKEYVLGMSSSAPSFSQDFHFVNNGLTNTKIISVGLADPSPEFAVTNIAPTNTLPFTLLSGEKMTVSVLFTPSQVGKVFFNQLVITTEQGIQSVSYPLQGLRTTTSSVHESSEPSVSVSLTPNPASASVTVSIKDAGQIDGATMTDELGKTIFYYNQPQQPEWKWELNPTRIAAGTYFIRINGKTAEGKPFIVTKRLVVQ